MTIDKRMIVGPLLLIAATLNGGQLPIGCSGSGHPAVILIHGLGDYAVDWALVQPAIAKEAEACAYDREPGPPPRGIATSARELHALLRSAHIEPPYVLVGHSWGGLIARMYAHDYPKDVAGMVLVDSTHEDEYLWINGKIIRPRFLSDDEWAALIAPHKEPAGGPPATPRPRPAITKLNPPYDKLPPDAQKSRIEAMSRPWQAGGGDTDDMRRDFQAMHDATGGHEHPLGDMPLVVLSKTPGVDDDDDYTPEQLTWNRDLQDKLATLSTNSVHIVAPRSGHHIQLDQPDVVVDAVHRVVDAVRHHRHLR